MICLLALIVFAVLGIFSSTHRLLAKEAFDCVFKRITLRKCESGLDKRLKSKITGKLMRRNPRLAGLLYKNFELLSWAFTILLVLSLVYSAYSGYNYFKYGNCYGKPSEAFCIFDPAGNTKASVYDYGYSGPVAFPAIDDDPYLGSKNATVTIIEFGCFRCKYTKKAEATIKEIIKAYGDKILYVYRDFPLNERHLEADIHSEAADCAFEQGKYWEYHDLLFEEQEMENHTLMLKGFAEKLSLNMTKFNECFDSRKYRGEVLDDFEDGLKAGIVGTPTFFINDKTLVGPRTFKDFKKIIDKELAK